MKHFILKMIYALVPILITSASAELLLREIPNDYSYKRDFLNKNSSNIETLFLGSSHTYYGVNPEFIKGNSFNASHISQSIDYDYEILKKYEKNWDNLKYIAIPIDYFTLFSTLSSGIEYWRVKNYEIYYDINISFRLQDKFEILSMKPMINLQRIHSFYLKSKTSITCSKSGYGIEKWKNSSLSKAGLAAAKRHTNQDKINLNSNINALQSIISFSQHRNIKIIFYTSPAYYTYVSNLDKEQLQGTFKIINNLTDKNTNCTYYNFLEDNSFDSTDFRDADHLNELGANKFTLKLDSIINRIE